MSDGQISLGERVRFVAKVRRGARGQRLLLQERRAGSWRPVTRRRLSSAGRSTVRITKQPRTAGRHVYRVVLRRKNRTRGATSTGRVVRVRAVPQAPVTGASVTNEYASSLQLAWTNPPFNAGARVRVRRSAGDVAPATASSGSAVPVPRGASSVMDVGLEPDTTYSYSVFVVGSRPVPVSQISGTTTQTHVAKSGEVPESTAVLEPSQVVAASGPANGPVEITVPNELAKPVGGFLLLDPSDDLPDGMVGEVVSFTPGQDGTTTLGVRPGALGSALPDMLIDQDESIVLEPVNTDDEGDTGDGAAGSGRVSVDRKGSSLRMRLSSSAFQCTRRNGSTANATDLFETGNPLPISVELSNYRWNQVFDPGSRLFNRSPVLLMQLTGEADIVAKFRAKVRGFSCELSPTWRRHHRLFRARVGTVPGTAIPVTLNLEFGLSFEVNGSAGLELRQHRYWGVQVSKFGDERLHVQKLGSADPATVAFSAEMSAEASLFADLSLMTGGGYRSANAQAGMYGTIGPALEASAARSTSRPRRLCITAKVGFKSTVGVRLELWVARWDLELGQASFATRQVYNSCDVADPDAGTVSGGDLGNGDVKATLRWDNNDDLDLHVVDPAGEEIYYGDPTSESGGELDHDAIPGCDAPEFGNDNIENIFWPTGGAPSGNYQVWVREFTDCTGTNALWRLVVTVDGEKVIEESGYGSSEVFSFEAQ